MTMRPHRGSGPASPCAVGLCDASTERPEQRVQAAVEVLADEPRPHNATALRGTHGYLRMRTGDYHIVYTVRDEELLVLVMALGHRREV